MGPGIFSTHFTNKCAKNRAMRGKTKKSRNCPIRREFIVKSVYGRASSLMSKYIQKTDRNARMSRIFMNSVDKSAFYMFFCFD